MKFNSVLTKVSNKDIDDSGSFTVPKEVTRIDNGAFKDCGSLKCLIISEGVIAIGDWAFDGCSNLETLSIPAGVTMIGAGAFFDCSNLKSLSIPATVTAIGSSAFAGCSNLETLIISARVTAIGVGTFAYCNSLKTLILPETLTSWDSKLLDECTQLHTIAIDSTDAAQIARIKALLPAEVQAKVTSLTLAQQAWDFKEQHLKEVERTALAPVLYSFFNLNARTMYKKRGEQNQQIKFPTLPNDVLANINEYIGAHKNPYYQRAKEAMDQLPLPKNNAELVVYANQVKALADNEAEKAIMSQEKYDVHPR